MSSITLIGPDGAGKTTITRRLETSGLLPFKYLYMGVSISSSNTALFTSRLAERFKRRSRGAAASSHRESSEPSRRGKVGFRHRLRAAARLTNRLADAWFRQGISWYYQLRGMVVLYDRHFVFDYAPEITMGTPDSLEKRLQRWCLTRLYPSPDLVIFLDAPGEVLFARKGESSPAELERRRQGFLRQGERLPNFVRVDATRPLEVVYQEVAEHIVRFQRRMPRATSISAA
jgi:thymidylate kinase